MEWIYDHASYNKVERAILAAPTLGVALRRLVDFYPLIQEQTEVSLIVEEQTTTLVYRILDPSIWPRTEDALYTLDLYSTLIKKCAPESWEAVEISLEAEQHTYRSSVSDVIKTDVYFGMPYNALHFPTSLLDRPLDIMPAVSNDILESIQQLLKKKRRKTSIEELVSELIYRGVETQQLNQDFIARELGMSTRTLRRKLADKDHSFQTLLDACRMQIAASEFQRSPEQSISEMALKLGYAEHSTFTRAFARWVGMPPQEFRRSVA